MLVKKSKLFGSTIGYLHRLSAFLELLPISLLPMLFQTLHTTLRARETLDQSLLKIIHLLLVEACLYPGRVETKNVICSDTIRSVSMQWCPTLRET